MVTLAAIACTIGFVAVVVLARLLWPARGMHERTGGLYLDTLDTTLPALPAPEEPWQPRAVPDVPDADELLTVVLSVARHHCYQYAARLAAMSWQSHWTLQRSYDMLAFATVAQANYRIRACHD